MDDIIKRKLNILIHISKVDGKFHKAEKALLKDFVKEHNLDPNEFKALVANPEELEVEKVLDKSEMMYLALKMINADKYLDIKELEFSEDMAVKMGYKKELIKEFFNKNLTREIFDFESQKWKL